MTQFHSMFRQFPPIRVAGVAILAILLCGLVWSAYAILPYESDWSDAYRPAALQLLAGRSPYGLDPERPFLNAPWILIPLIPFAILPPQLGRALIFTVSFACYAIVAIKLGAKPFALAAFLLSYPVIYGLIYGQIDGIVMLGYILPPSIGLFFILAKPQIGFALAIFWLIESWRTGRSIKVITTLLPVTIAYTVSFKLFGNWLVQTAFPVNQMWNTSLWPQSLPIGLVLLALAMQQRKQAPAIAASPFLSPYLAAHSWAAVLLGLLPNSLLVTIGMASIWVVWLIGGGPVGR